VHPKFSPALRRASGRIKTTPIVPLYQSSEIPVTSVAVVRDPSYSEDRPESPSRVGYSPEIDPSKFTLHILSDTPGVFQRLKYILLMTGFKKRLLTYPIPPSSAQSVWLIFTGVLAWRLRQGQGYCLSKPGLLVYVQCQWIPLGICFARQMSSNSDVSPVKDITPAILWCLGQVTCM